MDMDTMVWIHEFEGTSTTRFTSAPRLREAERHSRVLLNIIVSRKLLPIMTPTGDEFLAAWWKIVMGHRALWKKGIRHGDISLSNLMGCRSAGQFISILNDRDLSTKQDDPGCLERAGTIPFISLHPLIPKAIAGMVGRAYYHGAESFIWILTWICLRYENGKLLGRNRPLDEWLTVDARRCHKEKASYLSRVAEIPPTPSHQKNFGVAKQGLVMVYRHGGPFASAPTDVEVVFNTWLLHRVPALVREGNLFSGQQGMYTCS